MKKQTLINNEIDLIKFTKLIWEKKIKLFLIVLIFFTLGYIYVENREKSPFSKYSVIIENSKESEFFKFLSITNYLNQNEFNSFKKKDDDLVNFYSYTINPQSVINKFKVELLDFEEINQVIENKININKQKIIKTQDHFTLDQFYKGKENEKYYVFNFIWDDENEAIKIFDEILNFTLLNLKKTIYNDLDTLLKVKKNILVVNDSKRIEFLKEQSEIAKEIGLKDFKNKLDNIDSSNFFLSYDNAYYLRGYKAIDKEIKLIKNRKHEDIKIIGDEINFAKKLKTKWINYNLYTLKSKPLMKNNDKVILSMSLLLGIIIAIFYAFILNSIQTSKNSKN